MFLQRLDVFGNEKFPHGGIQVAARHLSSTTDYALTVDSANNAILAYNDTISGSPSTNYILANKVAPDGTLLWGASGITLASSTVNSISVAKAAVLSDGNYAFGYTSDHVNSAAATQTGFVLARVNAIGTILNSVAGYETGRSETLSDIQAGDNGSIIASWVRPTSTNFISASKWVYAQKFDTTLAPLWTGTGVSTNNSVGAPLQVFAPAPGSAWATANATGTYNATSGGSLSTAVFPIFIPDGSGGAVFSFYEGSGPKNAYVQHVSANGTKTFTGAQALTGAPCYLTNSLAPNPTGRFSSYVAYDKVNDIIYEASYQASYGSAGSNYAVVANKINNTGTRLWGDAGVFILPDQGSSFNQPAFVSAQLQPGGGLNVFFLVNSNTTNGYIEGGGVDSSGTITWLHDTYDPTTPDALDTVLAPKARLASATGAEGFSILAWSSKDTGANQIWSNNVGPLGAVGAKGVVLSGTVTLGSFTGPVGQQTVKVELWNGSTVVETHYAILNSDGTFSVTVNTPGTYDVSVRGTTWLRSKKTGQVIDPVNGLSGLTYSLTNGDIDGNNIVNINDYAILSDAFNAILGDAAYVTAADLDGNGIVNINDYAIVSDNFNKSGD